MSVIDDTSRHPWAVPPPEPVLTIKIRMSTRVATPHDVMRAVSGAFQDYGFNRNGTMTPFDQQPGYPEGHVYDRDGVSVGTWEIKEERR